MEHNKKLVDIISIKIYFELYTILYNFQANYHLHCFCQDVPGCCDRFKNKNYCLICQFYWNNAIDDLENVKRKPTKLLLLFEKIKNELFIIYKYDKFLYELWNNQVIYKNKWTGKITYLEDIIDFFILVNLKTFCFYIQKPLTSIACHKEIINHVRKQ